MSEARNPGLGSQTLVAEVEGRGAERLDGEAGGHRVQRVPPTEKRDRTQTSTVTVASVDPGRHARGSEPLRERDLEIDFFSGTGAGGQHRNRAMTSCRVRHWPTGLVRTAQSRSREANVREAKANLASDLAELGAERAKGSADAERKRQVGSGQRADKRRTYRFQDGKVHDHETGRSASVKKVMKGRFDLLWE